MAEAANTKLMLNKNFAEKGQVFEKRSVFGTFQ